MRALDNVVVQAVWSAFAGHLPQRPPDTHPLGCHRPRVADRVCFTGILTRLVTGCSWHVAAYLTGGVSATTLRRPAHRMAGRRGVRRAAGRGAGCL